MGSKRTASDGRDETLSPPPLPRPRLGIAERYAERMAQLVTRVDDQLAAALDELVVAGEVASRSDAVRIGLEWLIDRRRRHRIGAQIVAGYLAIPQADDEGLWVDTATIQMINEEPW